MVPRKGFDVLIAALAALADLAWRLTIAGDRTRDPMAAERLEADIARHGLAGRDRRARARVSSERLGCALRGADLFVLASRFEGYGMAYAEALAHGLPVIGTKAGAIPDTVPPEAGLLVDAGDVAALADALRRAHRRSGCAAAAVRGRARRGATAADLARNPRKSLPARWRRWHERVFRRMAGAARALRSARAQRGGSRRGRRRFAEPRPRSRSPILPAAQARPSARFSPRLPARQNWRLVDNDLGLLARARNAVSAEISNVNAHPDRSQPRSRSGARRTGRSGHDLGAARSGLGSVAANGSCVKVAARAPAGLCGAEL